MHQRHIAEPREGDVQRARNWRRGESQHIGVELELLQSFLVLHTEPVLLVNNDYAEVLEFHIGAQKPMSSNDNVRSPISE